MRKDSILSSIPILIVAEAFGMTVPEPVVSLLAKNGLEFPNSTYFTVMSCLPKLGHQWCPNKSLSTTQLLPQSNWRHAFAQFRPSSPSFSPLLLLPQSHQRKGINQIQSIQPSRRRSILCRDVLLQEDKISWGKRAKQARCWIEARIRLSDN